MALFGKDSKDSKPKPSSLLSISIGSKLGKPASGPKCPDWSKPMDECGCDESEEAGEEVGDEDLVSIAQDVASAAKTGDAQGLKDALAAFIDAHHAMGEKAELGGMGEKP